MSIRKLPDKFFYRRNHNESDEENALCKTAKKMKIAQIRDMSVLEIIEYIIKITEDKPASIIGAPSKFLKVLTERLGLTSTQALMMSVFVNKCDDNSIVLRDLANHFDGNNISILKCTDDIEALVKLGVIKRQGERRGNSSYSVPQKTLDALSKNQLPAPPKSIGLNAYEWLDAVEDLMQDVRYDNINDGEFSQQITDIIDNNLHLNCTQAIKKHGLDTDDLKLFMAISLCAINDNDDNIGMRDIDDYYKRPELRMIANQLEDGDHILFAENLIEHVNNHGMVDSSHWKLTDYSKNEVYSEFRFRKPKLESNELIMPDKIVEKKLYYNDEINRQIDELHQLLENDRMKAILDRLESKGMRRGFACLFYGTPGTGKTETVLQLAKATGRPIMQVNISSIRSKWVGETEQNIKACFDTYRKFAINSDIAPILFFNEADALFMTRIETAEHSVDKMENAMQNIILQEMENLEGILIATTNLQGSLDSAIERRFLYKIEFTKPTPAERSHIWQAMIPELSLSEALMLAERFDFSGGQIENIARKCIISDILSERDGLNIEALVERCKHESIEKEKSRKVGFVV